MLMENGLLAFRYPIKICSAKLIDRRNANALGSAISRGGGRKSFARVPWWRQSFSAPQDCKMRSQFIVAALVLALVCYARAETKDLGNVALTGADSLGFTALLIKVRAQ